MDNDIWADFEAVPVKATSTTKDDSTMDDSWDDFEIAEPVVAHAPQDTILHQNPTASASITTKANPESQLPPTNIPPPSAHLILQI